MQHVQTLAEEEIFYAHLQFLAAQIESVGHGEDLFDPRSMLQRKEALKRELDYCW